MAGRPSRRGPICEAALDLAAEGGNHAVTHQGIDARLGLAKGSTSYYYRTRHALVNAVIAHLAARSRELFAGSPPLPRPVTVDSAAKVIADQLETLVVERRRDVLARYALAADAAGDEDLRTALASCFFSLPAATSLFEVLGAHNAAGAAQDLLALLEGLTLECTLGARVAPQADGLDEWRDTLHDTVRCWLAALTVTVRR